MSHPDPIKSPAIAPVAERRRGAPMFYVRGLVSVLDKTEDEILRLIEDGSLLWVFDLSLVPDRCRRKELRILPQCVDDYQAGQPCRLEWDQVKQQVLPHDEPEITSLDIQRSCNVSSTHVTALIRRKLLTAISEGRTGPKGSALVRSSSFLQFLEARRHY